MVPGDSGRSMPVAYVSGYVPTALVDLTMKCCAQHLMVSAINAVGTWPANIRSETGSTRP